MIKSFQSVLSPLLIIAYVSGLKVFEFPTDHPKLWCSLLYILLFWSVYFLFWIYTSLSYTAEYSITIIELICKWLNIFIIIIIVFLAVYYNKKFRKCMKKIAIVDDTLEQLGTTTNYQKLRERIVWLILGWLVISILMNYEEAVWLKYQYNLSTITVIWVPCIINYCIHINFVDEIIVLSTLGYIGLKFDQINENLQKIIKNNKPGIKQVRKNHVLQPRKKRFLETQSDKHMILLMIHLHMELCKISRELNSIFGLPMTLKMALYFGYISACLQEMFATIFMNYANDKTQFIFIVSIWIVVHVLKLFFTNYICERVSTKASTTGDVIINASQSICDDETRENILQFLLQLTQAPLKFYGLRMFQFGYKFLLGFISSIATVLTILTQALVNKYQS